MPHREAADVHLVDHCVRPRHPGTFHSGPVELVVDDNRLRHEGCGILVVAAQVVAAHVAVNSRIWGVTAVDRLGVGINEQLGRIPSQPVWRIPRTVYAVSVPLSWPDARQVTVPDVEGRVVERDPLLGAVVGEQAHLHALGARGPEREVRAFAVEGRAERLPPSRPRPPCHDNHPHEGVRSPGKPAALDARVERSQPLTDQNARVYAFGCVAAMRTSLPPEADLYRRARA